MSCGVLVFFFFLIVVHFSLLANQNWEEKKRKEKHQQPLETHGQTQSKQQTGQLLKRPAKTPLAIQSRMGRNQRREH